MAPLLHKAVIKSLEKQSKFCHKDSPCWQTTIWKGIRHRYRQTNTHLVASLPEQPTWANNKNVKSFWILRKEDMMRSQWHQLNNMQMICTSLHTHNHASTSPLTFYRPDALSATQPTVSKHGKQQCLSHNRQYKCFTCQHVCTACTAQQT